MTKTGHTVTLSRGADQWTRWRGIAESPADAERLALREAGLAFRILSSRGTHGPADAPAGLAVTESLDFVHQGECAGTEIHQALRSAAHGRDSRPRLPEPWTADDAIQAGRALVRLIALTHPIGLEHMIVPTGGLLQKPAGFGEGADPNPGSSYTLDLEVLATPIGGTPDFIPLTGPWRDAMLACSLAAASAGRDGQGVPLWLEIPASATVRALAAANRRAQMAADARRVIAMMQDAGLAQEAGPFAAAAGVAPCP